jgi:hypothetical protein
MPEAYMMPNPQKEAIIFLGVMIEGFMHFRSSRLNIH